MYAYPSITAPKKFIEHAKAMGKAPDVAYCLSLLEKTGVSCVPGSGFGSPAGLGGDATFHLRTTILPREEKMRDFCDRFASHHAEILRKFGDGK